MMFLHPKWKFFPLKQTVLCHYIYDKISLLENNKYSQYIAYALFNLLQQVTLSSSERTFDFILSKKLMQWVMSTAYYGSMTVVTETPIWDIYDDLTMSHIIKMFFWFILPSLIFLNCPVYSLIHFIISPQNFKSTWVCG